MSKNLKHCHLYGNVASVILTNIIKNSIEHIRYLKAESKRDTHKHTHTHTHKLCNHNPSVVTYINNISILRNNNKIIKLNDNKVQHSF